MTALGSLNAPVAWYESDRESLREAARAVNDFLKALEKAPLQVAAIRGRDPSSSVSLRKSMDAADTSLLQFLLPIGTFNFLKLGKKKKFSLPFFLISFYLFYFILFYFILILINFVAEVERLSLWADPITSPRNPTPPTANWPLTITSAWQISPKLALSLGARFCGNPEVTSTLQRLVNQNAADPELQKLPEAIKHLANSLTGSDMAADSPALRHLSTWAPVNLLQAMSILSGQAGRHPAVQTFLLRSLHLCDPEQLSFFLPQLVQLLRHDPDAALENFLLETAQNSVYFAYLLVCQLNSEGTPPDEAFSPAVKRSNWSPPVDTGLWSVADRIRVRLWETLQGPVREQLDGQLAYFSSVTEISGKLYPVPKEERKSAAVKFVAELSLPRKDLFMPTDLHARVVAAKPESAAPMQSAAKCPILVAFDVEKGEPGSPTTVSAVEAAIFKVGDDCRQDVLALQVISLLKGQFDSAALPLPLVPYGVIPTGHECGIIEVVQHAKSRAQLVRRCC